MPNLRTPRRTPSVDVLVHSASWQRVAEAEVMVQDAVAAAAKVCDPIPFDCELAIVLTDDAAIRDLNRQWRGIDRPTNVLSFPTQRVHADETPAALGDIVIAYETLEQEAQRDGKTLLAHLAHLTVHGFLHLVGYEHRTDDEADDMERLEARILAELGLPDPYEGTVLSILDA